MRDLFKGYYQPTPEQFKEMWEAGTFIFDTNVLLNLYRYKKESREEILAVIEGIKDRVWIPYQVGLEFHRNRLGVLAEQNAQVSEIKNSIKQSIGSIEKKCQELNLDKRHSEIETASFMQRFKELSESVQQELSDVDLKKLTNDEGDDAILTHISAIFNSIDNTLGLPPKDQKVLDEIYKDGDFRAKNKIPPSFEDINEAKKNKSGEEYYAFEGLHYKQGYGDLIVWKQIIEYAKENKKKSIIFITDDKKEDWMRIINSHGKKTISARPELVSEIFKEAGVESFYIYDTDGFLNYSEKYLSIEIPDETFNDVKSVYYRNKKDFLEDSVKIQDSLLINPTNNMNLNQFLLAKYSESIMLWINNRYMYATQTFYSKGFDYTALDYKGNEVLIALNFIDLKYISIEKINYFLKESISTFKTLNVANNSIYPSFHLVLFFYTSKDKLDLDSFNKINHKDLKVNISEQLEIDFNFSLSICLLNTSSSNIYSIEDIQFP